MSHSSPMPATSPSMAVHSFLIFSIDRLSSVMSFCLSSLIFTSRICPSRTLRMRRSVSAKSISFSMWMKTCWEGLPSSKSSSTYSSPSADISFCLILSKRPMTLLCGLDYLSLCRSDRAVPLNYNTPLSLLVRDLEQRNNVPDLRARIRRDVRVIRDLVQDRDRGIDLDRTLKLGVVDIAPGLLHEASDVFRHAAVNADLIKHP